MTEAEWLVSRDLFAMCEVCRVERSIRKWRMFAITCCRSVWPVLSDWAKVSLSVLEGVASGELPDLSRAERSKGTPNPGPYGDRAVWKAIRPGKEARDFAR